MKESSGVMRNLIRKTPSWIKKPIKYVYGLIPYERRVGKVFWDTYNFLQESQWWSKEKIEEYQMRELEKLLKHAYENVPYYRRVFDERGLKPKDIQNIDDLKKLPYLTKEIIGNNLKDLVAQNYPRSKLQYVTTGGSTGIPMGFYQDKSTAGSIEWAFILTLWSRVGFKVGDKCVVLRGNVVKSANKGKLWEYDPINKDLILSSYHMIDETLPKYIAKIREFKPNFIQAYPSAVTILARFMKNNKIENFPSIKAILCGSENIYFWQRKLLEEVFQCRIYSWYGHAEECCLAGECEKSNYYHIFLEYGYTELTGEDGKQVNEENKLGEIVATGFNNYVYPFIRYRTMDMAIKGKNNCTQCGRQFQLLKKIEGRLQEMILTKTNRYISMTAINMHSDVFDNIKQFQFFQEEKGKVFFNIIRKNSYTEKDTEYIYRELNKKLGNDMDLKINFVDSIPRTKSGKYRFLIQKLPINLRG